MSTSVTGHLVTVDVGIARLQLLQMLWAMVTLSVKAALDPTVSS